MSVPTSSATRNQNLLQNDKIALSMNISSKSVFIGDKTDFQFGMMLASFGMCLWQCSNIAFHTW